MKWEELNQIRKRKHKRVVNKIIKGHKGVQKNRLLKHKGVKNKKVIKKLQKEKNYQKVKIKEPSLLRSKQAQKYLYPHLKKEMQNLLKF